jgi:hypothetical protein
MKKALILWLLSQKQGLDPSVKKKLLIGAGVFGVVLFIGIGAATYVGIKAVGYLVSQAPSQAQVGQLTQDLAEKGKAIAGVAAAPNCLATLQAHLDLNVWLTRSFSDNTSRMMSACLLGPSAVQKENLEKGSSEESESASSYY